MAVACQDIAARVGWRWPRAPPPPLDRVAGVCGGGSGFRFSAPPPPRQTRPAYCSGVGGIGLGAVVRRVRVWCLGRQARGRPRVPTVFGTGTRITVHVRTCRHMLLYVRVAGAARCESIEYIQRNDCSKFKHDFDTILLSFVTIEQRDCCNRDTVQLMHACAQSSAATIRGDCICV